MPIRHEYRITASAKDAYSGTSAKSGIPIDQLPGYDFTWFSHVMYDFAGNRTTDKRKSRMTARQAAMKFWDVTASKWPSAKMFVKEVEETTSQIFPETEETKIHRANLALLADPQLFEREDFRLGEMLRGDLGMEEQA